MKINKLFSLITVSFCMSSCTFNFDLSSVLTTLEENSSSEEISSTEISLPEMDYNRTIVTEVKKTQSGRAYYSYLDEPFSFIGGQIRFDGLTNRGEGDHFDPNAPRILTREEVKQYFIHAKEFGLHTLAISLDWRDLEPTKDNYNFDEIDMLMELAYETGMKFEILWFSTNMCGDVHSFQLPSYIYDDDTTYPSMTSNNFYFSAMYGYMGKYKVLDNPNLMEREYKAVKTLMNHIADYNKEKKLEYPVIGMQVHNEADNLVRWRYDQKDIKLNNERVSMERLWEMTLNGINNAAKGVKDSRYNVLTRCNMCCSYSINPFAQAPFASPMDVYNLEYIDIIGDDPYVESVGVIENSIQSYTFLNNYPHIAENMGDYALSPELLLAAVSNGGGYLFYDFATPEYFVYINGGGSYRMDQGLVNTDFTFKAHSLKTKQVLSLINKAGYEMLLTDITNIKTFNNGNLLEKNHEENYVFGSTTFTLKTSNSAIGYVLKSADGYLVGMTDDASFELTSEGNLGKVVYEVEYEKDQMNNLSKAYPIDNILNLKGGKLYYIQVK